MYAFISGIHQGPCGRTRLDRSLPNTLLEPTSRLTDGLEWAQPSFEGGEEWIPPGLCA